MKHPLRSLTALLLVLLLAGCSASPTDQIIAQAKDQSSTSPAPSEQTADSAAVPISTPAPTSEPEPTPEPIPSDLTEGVVLGRRVFLYENGVAFWGAEEVLCSALVDDTGNLYDFYAEGSANTRVLSSAIMGTDYYMSTYDGFFRFNLTDLEQGNTTSELLCDDTAYDGFSIYGGTIYYQDNDELLTLPIDGGEPQAILSGITDYEVTNQGIFYTNKIQGLHRLDPLSGSIETLADCPTCCHISLQGSTFYVWAGEQVLEYRYDTGTSQILTLSHLPDMEEHIWAGTNFLLYTSIDDDVYSYNLETGSEVPMWTLSTLPSKGDGCFTGTMLYYIYTDTVYWDDVGTGDEGSMDLDDFLSGGATPTPTPASVPSTFFMGNHLVSVEYDDHFDVVNDYFMVTLPKSPAWAAELIDDNTLKFYYIPGRDAGYDGTFLTIMAVPLSEEASLDYPSYAIAGRDSQKLYVALFPTDLRYDATSDTQREEFNYLQDYVMQISEGAVTSPFQIAR